MFIDINKIGPEGLRFDAEPDLSDFQGPGRTQVTVRGVRLAGRAEPSKRGVNLRARLDATVTTDCSRCAEPFDLRLDSDVSLTLVRDAVEYAGEDAQIDAEDASVFYAQEGKVSLASVAAEQIYLNLPLKPVCKEDCKGLCPACGANRNLRECGCRVAEVDPRLAPLLRFKGKS